MLETDEQSLIAASRKGSHGAFETLIERHQRMIYSLALRMTGSMADAEDLAQETFIQAFQHLDAFRGGSFGAWLYRIAVNRCLNFKQRLVRREQVLQEWAANAADNTVENPKVWAAVQEALLKLPPKQRAAVVLTVYEGMNHAEAAQALGCSETTVSWRLFIARGKLKCALEDTLDRRAFE